MNSSPLSYLDSAAGPRAQATLPLTWFMLVVSVTVCIIIGFYCSSQEARVPQRPNRR